MSMVTIDQAYIDGTFAPVQGSEVVELLDPATELAFGTARFANRDDAKRAIAAAVEAQKRMRRTGKKERIDMLRRLSAALLAHSDAIRDATVMEYGGPLSRAKWVSDYAARCFAEAAKTLEDYPLTRRIGEATVVMNPVGVSALIAPWNSTAGTMCSKLASALAAGCATVIKGSELSPLQCHVVAQAVHEAALPPGVCNILVGRGNDVGDELSINPGISRISFTGSTATGKVVARAAVDTMKRVSLSLTGKSATLVLDDADLATALPLAVGAAFMNNGQACVAGTRLLVPHSRMAEALGRLRDIVGGLRVGLPGDPSTFIGPLASRSQYDRVQGFIRRGLAQGAGLLVGGEGRSAGFERGWFVQPTVFTNVCNEMDIAREEIFGPVLSVIGFGNDEEAIRIANDSPYGLQAYVLSADPARAETVAMQLEAGTVLVNRIAPELLAPFGGVKQSGIGREFGVFGLESYLEPLTIADSAVAAA